MGAGTWSADAVILRFAGVMRFHRCTAAARALVIPASRAAWRARPCVVDTPSYSRTLTISREVIGARARPPISRGAVQICSSSSSSSRNSMDSSSSNRISQNSQIFGLA